MLITSIGPEEETAGRTPSPGEEIQLWINDGTVQGFAWFTKFNGVVPDARWVQPMAEAFGRHAKVEAVFPRRRRRPRSP